ncbi:MAG: RNA-guided endonuclease InsQ/TnpB family protein [Turicibacter sp.]
MKTVTVKKDSVGDLWICFSLDNVENQTEQFKTGKTAGFDFGMKTFLTVSDERTIKSPLCLFHTLDKLRRKSRNLSKKQSVSNSRKKARIELSKLHRKISTQREDFQWKTALEIVRKNDTLCFEDLNMKGMQMMWGRKINDLSFASFLIKVEYLAQKHGKKVVKIGRLEPSSKACFDCGYIYKDLQLKERIWHCPSCGKTHDRDLNAAKIFIESGHQFWE